MKVARSRDQSEPSWPNAVCICVIRGHWGHTVSVDPGGHISCLFVFLSPVKFVRSFARWQYLATGGYLIYRVRYTCLTEITSEHLCRQAQQTLPNIKATELVSVRVFQVCDREGHGNGNENQSRSVPFHWFHSRPVPAGCSENVNHSRPVPLISKPFPPVPFHQYCWTNRPISK